MAMAGKAAFYCGLWYGMGWRMKRGFAAEQGPSWEVWLIIGLRTCAQNWPPFRPRDLQLYFKTPYCTLSHSDYLTLFLHYFHAMQFILFRPSMNEVIST